MDPWQAFLLYFTLETAKILYTEIAEPTVQGPIVDKLKACVAALRGKRKDKSLTPRAAETTIRKHLPDVAQKMDWTWLRTFDIQQDMAEVKDQTKANWHAIQSGIGQLSEVAGTLKRLESTTGVGQDAVRFLVGRVQESCDALAPAAAQFDDLREELQTCRARLLEPLPIRHTVIRALGRPDAADRLMRAFDLHPEKVYLNGLIERKELLQQAAPGANTLVTGIPGAGKTTLMHQIVMRDRAEAVVVVDKGFGSSDDHLRYLLVEDLPETFTLVYDNIQFSPEPFQKAVFELQQIFGGRMRLLCACRTADLDSDPMCGAAGFREALHLSSEVAVPELSAGEAAGVVSLCEMSWGITVEEQVREWLIKRGGRAYATPFYFISMLAPIRAKDDRTAGLVDILALPEPEDTSQHIVCIWSDYWGRLGDREHDLLRSIRIIRDMGMTPDTAMVGLVAEGVFGWVARDQRGATERLGSLLWLSRSGLGVFSCYDVQLEAVDLRPRDHDAFVKWAIDFSGAEEMRLRLLNQGGVMEYDRHFGAATAAERAHALNLAASLWERGATACVTEERARDRAGFLNNASSCYSDLAAAAEDVGERREWLKRAEDAIEKAIAIRTRLNLPADLASSLNNASNRYLDLAAAVEGAEERRGRLQQAVDAIEKAVDLYARLNLSANLAGSLNNASECYASLASAAEGVEERREWLGKAVDAIEKAVGLHERLNLPADLAMSLNNASDHYSDLAVEASGIAERGDWLRRAVEAIDRSVAIRTRLNLPSDLASSLNNASNRYLALAAMVESLEERRQWLRKGVDAIEKAVGMYRRLSLPADLASSLHNASACYSDLAASTEGLEERKAWVRKSVEAIESAVWIRTRVGLPVALAKSLAKACHCYLDVAALAGSARECRPSLDRAIDSVDRAVRIRRRLGQRADLAMSLRAAARARGAAARSCADKERARKLELEAARALDEAVTMLEQSGRNNWLLRAYREAVKVHEHLMDELPTSAARVQDYAARAAQLLRSTGQPEEAAHFEDLAGVVATTAAGGPICDLLHTSVEREPKPVAVDLPHDVEDLPARMPEIEQKLGSVTVRHSGQAGAGSPLLDWTPTETAKLIRGLALMHSSDLSSVVVCFPEARPYIPYPAEPAGIASALVDWAIRQQPRMLALVRKVALQIDKDLLRRAAEPGSTGGGPIE